MSKVPQRSHRITNPFGGVLTVTPNTATGKMKATVVAADFPVNRVDYRQAVIHLVRDEDGTWREDRAASGGMYLSRADKKELPSSIFGGTFNKIKDTLTEAAVKALTEDGGKLLDESILAEDIERRDALLGRVEEMQKDIKTLTEQADSLTFLINQRLAVFNK